MAIHDTQYSMNHLMRTSSGDLTFQRGMFISVPIIADLIVKQNRRQQLIDNILLRHSHKHYNYHYSLGNLIMVKVYDLTKMQEKLHGPYPIVEV